MIIKTCFNRIYVSVQKCHNAPICGLFAKSANLIFKFLSLKISLIQADCHWKQVLVVRSTRFHGLEQSLEILPERDSGLLASLDKGIVHCRSQCTLNTTEEQRALALYGLETYRSFSCQVIYGIFTIVSIGKDLLPKLMEIVQCLLHQFRQLIHLVRHQVEHFILKFVYDTLGILIIAHLLNLFGIITFLYIQVLTLLVWTLTTNTSNDTDSQKAYAKVSGCFIVSQKVLVFNTITIFIKLLFNLNISISRKMGSSILCNISYSSNQLPCNRI